MKKLFAVLLGLALLFALTLPAAACWEAPTPFAIYAADGQVFRFAPNEPQSPYETMTATISLHDADGEELWRVNDFYALAFEHSFLFSEDLNSFAFFFPNTAHYALEFFSNGLWLATYTVDDLVDSREEGLTLSTGYPWEDVAGRAFNLCTNELTVVTRDGVSHVFNLATGQSPWISSYVFTANTATPQAVTVTSTVNVILVFGLIVGAVLLLAAAIAMVVALLRRRKT